MYKHTRAEDACSTTFYRGLNTTLKPPHHSAGLWVVSSEYFWVVSSESESEIFRKLLLNPRKQQRISNSPTLPRSTQLWQFWYWNKLNYYFLKNWVFSRTLWLMTKCIIIISFCSNFVSFKHSCIAQFKHFLSLKKYENNLHLFIDVWKPQMLILLWIPFF